MLSMRHASAVHCFPKRPSRALGHGARTSQPVPLVHNTASAPNARRERERWSAQLAAVQAGLERAQRASADARAEAGRAGAAGQRCEAELGNARKQATALRERVKDLEQQQRARPPAPPRPAACDAGTRSPAGGACHRRVLPHEAPDDSSAHRLVFLRPVVPSACASRRAARLAPLTPRRAGAAGGARRGGRGAGRAGAPGRPGARRGAEAAGAGGSGRGRAAAAGGGRPRRAVGAGPGF